VVYAFVGKLLMLMIERMLQNCVETKGATIKRTGLGIESPCSRIPRVIVYLDHITALHIARN
jgi:hypothetical protein